MGVLIEILQMQKNSHEAHPVGVRVSRRLCRDPHVLLDADAELDFDLVVVVDLDPLYQPGNDHVLGLCFGLIKGLCPGEQVCHFLSGILGGVLFLFHIGFGFLHPALRGFALASLRAGFFNAHLFFV